MIIESVTLQREHPQGATQGLCSASVGLLALLIAFIGYTGFSGAGSTGPWQPKDAIHLTLAFLAAVALVSVPWFATQPQLPDQLGKSIDRARWAVAMGGVCTVLAITIFIVRDFFGL